MSAYWSNRRLRVVAGGAAVLTLGLLAAGCGTGNEKAPPSTSTTTTTTTTTAPPSSAAPPAPTEKGISPTGGNLFSPQVIAPAAPTEPPGVHRRN